MNNKGLEIKDLTFKYGNKTILDNISFKVENNDFIAIVGKSGAGKSTLLRCLNMLNIPQKGEIIFDNKNILSSSKKQLKEIRRDISFIFQDYNVLDNLYTIENVLTPYLAKKNFLNLLFGYTKKDYNEGIEYLKKVGLEEEAFRKSKYLSGGQKQRVAIAKALAQQPKLLLADEPVKNFIIKKSLNKLLLVISIIFLISISFEFYSSNDFSVGFSRIQNLLKRMFPIDFSILNELKQPILETINIALFSTILALFTALLVLPLTTNVLFKLKVIPRIISAIFSIFRTIPFLIIAAILVSLFSTGVFSGFICMYIINLLTASKLLKEYAEEVDVKHLEAIECLGVSKFAIYKTAIISNLKPVIISVYFLMLESSIRGASVLGLVGAGGIGQRLWQELNHLRYDRVSLIILILILLIFIMDMISYYFRSREYKINVTYNDFILKKYSVRVILPAVLLGSVIYVSKFVNITNERFLLGLKQLKVLIIGLFHPDTNYFGKMLSELLVSLEIALFATIFAAITAIFTSYFSSVNLFGKYNAVICKVVINILRTFPPIIVALIFFRGFGPGMISSFFALYIYTVGVITKMYSEVLESIQENILLTTKSLGLGSFVSYIKIIFNGYFPEFISIVLYRFESNIKNSTILGMVGAGGIGHLLVNNIEYRNWNRISTLLIGLCITIIIIENISYIIRIKVKK